MDDHDALVADLRDIADDTVLGIGVYEDGDYEVLFIRPDFADRYAEDRLDEIARDMYLEGVSVEYQQQMLSDMGDLNATVRLFEGATSINVPLSESAGVGVGLDDEATISMVGDIVDRCVAFRETWRDE